MTTDRANPDSGTAPSPEDRAHARAINEALGSVEGSTMQAAEWLVRRQDGIDAHDEAEFQTWLAADWSHRCAYEQLSQVWHRLDEISSDDIAQLKASLGREQSTRRKRRSESAAPRHDVEPVGQAPNSIGRRRFLPQATLAGAVLATAGGGWLAWDYLSRRPTFQQAYATGRGQQLSVALPDGSTVDLDTASRIEIVLYRQHREVRLTAGQAMFTVQANPNRPFDVLAGTVKVTVVGTRFSVRHTHTGLLNGDVYVAVEEGRVQVASAELGRLQSIELTAGQQITADAAGNLGAVSSIAASNVALWRKGRVAFDNTPLAQALQEFERYENTGLVIHDTAVGAMRITGSFDLKEVARFARALPRVLPVRLRERNGVVEVVRAG